jgi:hypothetical protein
MPIPPAGTHQDLHQRIDNHTLQDADAINHHLTSLSLERDICQVTDHPGSPELST